MSTEGWTRSSRRITRYPHLTEEREAGLADPERYTAWAREHGVMWGEDAEEWLASPAAGYSRDGRDLQGRR